MQTDKPTSPSSGRNDLDARDLGKIIVPVALLLMVALLWLPVGLRGGLTADAWHNFAEVDRGVYLVSPMRPFLSTPWRIAYLLASENFIGVNVVLIALLVIKSLLVYQILHLLNTAQQFAFGVAALVAIFPADTGLFYLGALPIHFMVALLLAAVYMLLRYWKYRRPLSVVAMMTLQALSLGIYEAYFPVIAAVPLLLWWQQKHFSRRLVRVSLIWYIVPVIMALRLLYVVVFLPASADYQSRLFTGLPTLNDLFSAVANVFGRHFLTGWTSPTAMSQPIDYLIAGGVAVLVFAAALRVGTGTVSKRHLWVFGLSGIVLILLCIILYLPTSARFDTSRVFYLSCIGGGLVIAAVLQFLIGGRRAVFALAVACLCGLGAVQLLAQHRAYYAVSSAQETYVAELSRVLGGVETGSTIIVVDEDPDQPLIGAFGSSWYLRNIVTILYANYDISASLCYPHVDIPLGGTAERCTWNADGVMVTINDGAAPFLSAPYDSLIALRYSAEEGFEVLEDIASYAPEGAPLNAYQPDRLFDPAAGAPPRLATLFSIG